MIWPEKVEASVGRGRRLAMLVTSSMTATTFLRGYLRFLREDGWLVTLVCAPDPGLQSFADREHVTLYEVPMRREPAPWADLRSLFHLTRVLRRIKPDVLVYATPKASLLGSIAGTVARVPHRIYELWGLRLETATGMSRVVFRALESLTASRSTAVIANSDSLARRARELRVDGGHAISVLGAGSSQGVDTDWFSRDQELPELDPATRRIVADVGRGPVVGFVGRIHPDKGVEILIEALSVAADSGRPYTLLLVGGDEGADVAAQIAQLPATITVHRTGHVGDTRPYFRAMSVLVLPSRREGFPNVVLEAAAMSVPTITTDATGCVDSVIPGVTGTVVPVDDVTGLATQLSALDATELAAWGTAARTHVLDHYQQSDVWAQHSRAFGSQGNPVSDDPAPR